MTSEYIEQRNGGYCVAGTRISLDSVVYSFKEGNSPEAIRQDYPLLDLSQIYGAIAFYLDHEAAIDQYLRVPKSEGGRLMPPSWFLRFGTGQAGLG
jgi:uncharacterized protein (DUF433 family)